ncbi:hypothetical protein ACRTDJ_17180 [Shewanella algae]
MSVITVKLSQQVPPQPIASPQADGRGAAAEWHCVLLYGGVETSVINLSKIRHVSTLADLCGEVNVFEVFHPFIAQPFFGQTVRNLSSRKITI